MILALSKINLLFHDPISTMSTVGEKSMTEKAIIEALQAREVWQRRKSLQHSQAKISEPSSTPTTQLGFTKMSDIYGGNSPTNIDESFNHQKYDKDRTKH